ncbi:hypothetical protein cypCar_00027545 [Cyprinus carpio]|nr:hypothetical protein cypCar_00027545 [Cyprinus carpio]
MDDTILSLKTKLWEKEREIAVLKKKLDQSEKGNSLLTELLEKVTNLSPLKSNTTLNNDDIMRYSRQLLLPELGVKGQVAISNISVLVVGCGGLSCCAVSRCCWNRCLYPAPPPPETITNCSDGGVLGVGFCIEVSSASFEKQLLMFDGQEGRFRSIRLRPKQAECVVCGEMPTVTELQDYEKFCGSAATDKCRRLILLTKEQRVSVQEYKAVLDSSTPHLLIDVRPKVEVDICHLPTSIHIPLSSLENKKAEHITLLKDTISDLKQKMDNKSQVPVFVVCKLGNDSQKAVQLLEKMSGLEIEQIAVKDVIGGLMAWAKRIDPTFPQY